MHPAQARFPPAPYPVNLISHMVRGAVIDFPCKTLWTLRDLRKNLPPQF